MAEEQDLKWAVQNGDLEKVQSIIGNVSNNKAGRTALTQLLTKGT